MRDKYRNIFSIRVTDQEAQDLAEIPGNRNAFIRSCIRQGIAYYKGTLQKVNSENAASIAAGPGPEASPRA